MSESLWNLTHLHVTSGRDIETQAACGVTLPTNDTTLLCIPVVLVCAPATSGSSRRLSTTPPTLGMSIAVPASLQAQLTDPGSYIAVSNTAAGSSATADCTAGSSYDNGTGMLNVTGCGYGSYSLRVMQLAGSAASGGGVFGAINDPTPSAPGLRTGGIAGVVIGGIAFVALAVVGVVVVRRRASSVVGRVAPGGGSGVDKGSTDVAPGDGSPQEERRSSKVAAAAAAAGSSDEDAAFDDAKVQEVKDGEGVSSPTTTTTKRTSTDQTGSGDASAPAGELQRTQSVADANKVLQNSALLALAKPSMAKLKVQGTEPVCGVSRVCPRG